MDKTTLAYRSGDAFLPPKIVTFLHTYIVGNEKSLYYINLWHINHLFSGVLFGLVHIFLYKFQTPYMTYFVIHTLWEIWQLWIGMTIPNIRGVVDIFNDTLFGLLGLFVTLKSKQ